MHRKILKRFTAAVLSGALLLCTCACGDNHGSSNHDGNAWYNKLSFSSDDYMAPDPVQGNASEEQTKFNTFLDEMFEENVTNDSVTFHYKLRHPENYNITPPEPTFGDLDLSDEAMEKELKELEEDLDELHSFNRELLTADQKYMYDLIEDLGADSKESYDYLYLYEPFAYTSGLQSNYPITMSEYKFYSKEDVDTYLALLDLTPDYFDFYLQFEDKKIEKGLFMNETSAKKVIEQCEKFTDKVDTNMMVETFDTRLENVEGLTAEEKTAYKEKNLAAIKDKIIPSYKKVIDYFEENKSKGKNELGLCYLEGGKDYYTFLLRSKVGTDKTPEQVIERLDKAVSDTLGEMYTAVYANYEAYENYINNSESIYKDIDLTETIQKFETCFADRFPEMPEVTFTAQEVHPSLQGIISPAFYMTPAIDDYTSNSIYFDPTQQKDGARLWSTLAHEGVPGHMYQFTYYRSRNPHPLRGVCSFDGYEEGWANYVENMAYDYYDYGENREFYAKISRINNQINILVSSRIEIGVNYEGWDLQKVKDYMVSLGFGSDGMEDVYNYVISEPVNYQMYCMGWLEFEDLKTYAKGMLKEKFDEQEFHKVVLDAGPSKFYQLRKVVTEYIESK